MEILKGSSINYSVTTIFPGPQDVVDAVEDYITRIDGNPGGTGYQLSIDASENVFSVRDAMASLSADYIVRGLSR